MSTFLLLVNATLLISLLYHVLTAAVFILKGETLEKTLKATGEFAFFFFWLVPFVFNIGLGILFCCQQEFLFVSIGLTMLVLYAVDALFFDHAVSFGWCDWIRQAVIPCLQVLLVTVAFLSL